MEHKINGVVYKIEPKADLRGAGLSKADLSKADLSKADLRWANLSEADLRGADLSKADLRWANLRWANLSKADLREADLSRADLRWANLSKADLSEADLREADLSGANLRGAKMPPLRTPEGSLVGYKQVYVDAGYTVVKLRIPEDAARTASWVGTKLRAEYAEVIEGTGYSLFAGSIFMYEPGVTVRPDKWDPDPRVECTHGIHFFLTREEAEAY